jgi:hypothetical protein
MKKLKLIFTTYCLLFTVCSSYAQVPADSLSGTYAGQYWYANPHTSPWVITPDTFYVNNIDSANCTVNINGVGYYFGNTYYTDYYSCNSSVPSNNYIKFYSGDSIRVSDSISEPPPPPNNYASIRFYGKRISNKTDGINEVLKNEQINVYPNPAINILTIEILKSAVIDILDIQGQTIIQQTVQQGKTDIDISGLAKGVYILRLCGNDKTVVSRIVKE